MRSESNVPEGQEFTALLTRVTALYLEVHPSIADDIMAAAIAVIARCKVAEMTIDEMKVQKQ